MLRYATQCDTEDDKNSMRPGLCYSFYCAIGHGMPCRQGPLSIIIVACIAKLLTSY